MRVILYNVRSLYNVGSIFRTSDAAGVEKLYLCGITPEPIDRFGRIRPPLAKVALGAEKSVAWDASARSARATLKLLDNLKKEGYKIFAIEQARKSTPYYKVVLRPPPKPFDKAPLDKARGKQGKRDKQAQDKNKIALIFGNEVKGLPPAVLKKADKILEIPMRGKKESLNVAVAFGIVIFRLLYK